ncbi:MAG: alpha/beta hydrolase [Isosphaeraceae bacterium]
MPDAPFQPTDPQPAAEPIATRRWLTRLALRAAKLAAVIYLGVTLVLYLFQTRMIFAGSATQGLADYQVRPAAGCSLVKLQSPRGEPIAALFGPALTSEGRPRPDARNRPTLLYFYGNGMTLRDSQYDLERFRRLGVNVLIPEYLGYGMSGGQPSESGCYETADAAYDHLQGRTDVDSRAIVVGGWSLGGAVAIDLASRRQVAGVFVMSTFTSMTEMAHRSFPYLPTSLLLHHRFESLAKIGSLRVPILIGHGAADSIVPPVMARRLAEAAAASPRVEAFTVGGADHNDVFEVRTTETLRRLGAFLGRFSPEAGE